MNVGIGNCIIIFTNNKCGAEWFMPDGLEWNTAVGRGENHECHHTVIRGAFTMA